MGAMGAWKEARGREGGREGGREKEGVDERERKETGGEREQGRRR